MTINFDLIGKGQRFIQRTKRRIIYVVQSIKANKHPYTSLMSYAYEHPDKAKILSMRVEDLACSMNGNEQKLQYAGQVIVKSAVLKNASCYVYSDIIKLTDGQCLYDLKELDCLLDDVLFNDEILLKDTKHWCKLKPCSQIRHIDSAIKIGGMFGFNYYHCMFQLLPKMLETQYIDPAVPLLLDRSVSDIPNMQALVDYCNKEHRDILYMDYDVEYNVDTLYYITSPNVCIPNWRNGVARKDITTCGYSKISIETLVNTLIPYKSKTFAVKERIFISRRSTKRRRYNEDELWEVAKQCGFEKVFPEDLNIEEQIALFNNARVIIAANGAALTNLIFCSKDCTLIMLCNTPVATPLFSSIMNLRQGKVIELHRENENGEYQNDFYIVPKALEQAWNKIEKNK